MEDARRIQIEHEAKIRIQPHQHEHQRGEAHDDSHQPRDRKKTEASFEFVQPSHRLGKSSASETLALLFVDA